jgi:exonuclease V gamma subunit
MGSRSTFNSDKKDFDANRSVQYQSAFANNFKRVQSSAQTLQKSASKSRSKSRDKSPKKFIKTDIQSRVPTESNLADTFRFSEEPSDHYSKANNSFNELIRKA